MYKPIELFRFALSEFGRGLQGLTDDESRVRLPKADGSQMNAISWTVGHIAGHWLSRPERLQRYAPGSEDPTPLPLSEALELLEEAREFTEGWLPDASDELLSTARLDARARPGARDGESVGTGVMRAVLHTWFHCGEINAIRQQLGHPEIFFLGDITEFLEWRPGSDVQHGYRPIELARFTFSEFERGFAGLTEEEARKRIEKSDGSQMNAATWTVKHCSVPWLFARTLATGAPMPSGMRDYFGDGADPTPPSVEDAFALFEQAKASTEAWLPDATDELLSSKREGGPMPDENIATLYLRAVLHTWFHIGEINATRQLLGHPAIPFVGQLSGNLEWRGATG